MNQFVPDDGEQFWHFAIDGEIFKKQFDGLDTYHVAMLHMGNCFPTHAEAVKGKEVVRLALTQNEYTESEMFETFPSEDLLPETERHIRGFSYKLRPLRQALNLSVNNLSALIDVNERTIRRWEYGEIVTPKAVILLLRLMLEATEIPAWNTMGPR